MKTAAMLKLLCLVQAFLVTTHAQCTRSPQGQDSKNGAYITVTSPTSQGYRCRMEICPGGNAVTNTTYVNAIKGQMCTNHQTLLGCVPDTVVASNLVSSDWYNVGCDFCSCNMNNQVQSGKIRQAGGAQYVQFNNAGQECQILECGYTQCYPSNSSLAYAYFPKPTATNRIWFPNPSDEWGRVARSRWTEFDVPTSFACPRTMGSPNANLCDVSDATSNPISNLTLWKGTKYFQWVQNKLPNGTDAPGGQCEIKTCTGSNVFTTLSTSQITSNIPVNLRNFIRRMCATQLKGCYNSVANWRYDSTAARRSDCANNVNFCNQIYCSCSPSNATGYSVRRLTEPFTGVGMKVPESLYHCEEYQCDVTGRIRTAPATIETSRFIPIPAGECPNTNRYYMRSGTFNRGSQDKIVPMTYRQSSNPQLVTYGVTSQLFCSSLGYQLPTPQRKCYRSPLYSILNFGSLSSFCQATGNCSHTHGRTASIFSSCQAVTKSTRATTYQYAPISSVNNIDNNWVEYQCFPNASNFRMESICESRSSNLLWDTTVTSNQLAGEPKRCLESFEAKKTILEYTCGQSLLLNDNKCEHPQISNYVKLYAGCACQHVASQTAGGDGRYAEQAKSMIYSRYLSQAGAAVVTNLRQYGCTYRFSCSGGSANVKVMKPEVSGRFIVRVPCDEVNFSLLKSRLETVLSRYGRVVTGSQRGVILDIKGATDSTSGGNPACKVPFKSLMTVPEMADWFIGNLTATTGTTSPAFAPGSYEGVQVRSAAVVSASTMTLPSWVHVVAGLTLVISLCV